MSTTNLINSVATTTTITRFSASDKWGDEFRGIDVEIRPGDFMEIRAYKDESWFGAGVTVQRANVTYDSTVRNARISHSSSSSSDTSILETRMTVLLLQFALELAAEVDRVDTDKIAAELAELALREQRYAEERAANDAKATTIISRIYAAHAIGRRVRVTVKGGAVKTGVLASAQGRYIKFEDNKSFALLTQVEKLEYKPAGRYVDISLEA
jgi:hypothetical protein